MNEKIQACIAPSSANFMGEKGGNFMLGPRWHLASLRRWLALVRKMFRQ